MSGDFKLGILIGLLILALMVIFLTNKPRADEPQTDSDLASNQKELLIPEELASSDAYQAATGGDQTAPPATSWSATDATATASTNEVVITRESPQDLISNAHFGGLGQADTLGQAETTSEIPAEATRMARTLDDATAAVEESTFPASHVVAKGETLSSISAKYYGTHKWYHHIRKANSTSVSHIDALSIGQTIQIPAPPETARTVAVAPRAEAPAAPADHPATSSSVPRTHKVKKGESLCHISRTYYNGSETRWRKILEANRSRITDPRRLQVGTKLVIPPI